MIKDIVPEGVLKDRMKIQDITKPLLNRYVKLLKDFFGDNLMAVAVFGSLARGEAKFPGSDIDLLIVIKGIEKLSFGERVKQTIKVEKKLSRTEEYAKFENVFGWSPSIQEIILTSEELKWHPPILLDLTTDAVILYDEGILSEELEKLRKKLGKLKAKKIKHNESWFWILKPDLKLGEVVEL